MSSVRLTKKKPLYYQTHLRKEHMEWMREFMPGVTATRDYCDGYRYMPAYKMGKWDGKVHHITFENEDQVMLFKLTWC